MIKGLDSKLRNLQVTGTKTGTYNGRTELGVGEHDKVKKRLNEERHQDYRNHMARKEMERRAAKGGYGDSPPAREGSIGSVCDIGYETSMNIAHQRKQLNDARKAEYVAHLAAQSASIQTDRHDGSNACTQTAQAKQQDEYTSTFQQSQADQVNDDRKQKQRDYAEALRLQIEEKKKSTDQIRRKEKEEDRKNMEMAQGSHQGFSYGSYSQRNSYEGQTTDFIRRKEKDDDRKNLEMAQGRNHDEGSYIQRNNYDGQTTDQIIGDKEDERKYLEMVRRSNQGNGSYSQDNSALQ